MYETNKMFMYTRQEICAKLDRASSLTCGGVETMFLSDRLEPYLELFRGIQYNTPTRMYYWPEMCV